MNPFFEPNSVSPPFVLVFCVTVGFDAMPLVSCFESVVFRVGFRPLLCWTFSSSGFHPFASPLGGFFYETLGRTPSALAGVCSL